MNMPKKSCKLLPAMVIAAAAAGLSAQAHAQERHELRGPRILLDARYHHDHYYPWKGYVVETLPVGSLGVSFGPDRYFFHAGVWFHPVGARFEVVTPPIGIVLPALPPDYVTLSIGGLSYFYANGVYYAPAPGSGYTVVAPPAGADTARAVAPSGQQPASAAGTSALPTSPLAREPVLYPRNGQTADQMEADKKQCQHWAATQPATGEGSVYDRALDACLDGRGYSVR